LHRVAALPHDCGVADPAGSRGTLRVLFVEDNEDDAALLQRHLERAGYEIEAFRVDTRDSFRSAVENAKWDVVVSDHSMPHFSSTEALQFLKSHGVDCPFIIVSGTIGEDMAVEAMRAGAHDYVLKNNLARLAPAIDREIGDAELRRQAREERAARQAVELQLQQSQKMEAVGRLAGGIAHDFNNLLTAILGFTGLALNKTDTAGAPVKFELEQVKQAAERAARFTRQLLAFSRQQVLSPRLIDPDASIESMMPMLRQLLGEDVELSITDRAAGKVRVDPGQFEQVVMNLAVNARDAMPNGGTLRLGTAHRTIAQTEATALQLQSGDYMVLTVTDNGFGMDDATRARIFEPFFTTKPPGQGTGLGLSTVYGILKQSNGAIEVETAVSKGTTFRVYLPVAPTAVEAHPPVRRPAPRVGQLQGTVLVAEDEESVRLLVETVLTNAGFHVYLAGSGTEAAELFSTIDRPIDLLISDIIMPGMIGPDLARMVLHRSPQTRVLYITGYATHSAVPPGFLQEDDALLQKPFLPEQLLAKVQERLGLSHEPS
jgi:two-component system cell cycle sensor histidine kinase/response regulator CckA